MEFFKMIENYWQTCMSLPKYWTRVLEVIIARFSTEKDLISVTLFIENRRPLLL